MSDYIPVTARERAEMLAALGVKSVDELFEDIPAGLRAGALALPEGLSQQEVYEKFKNIASENRLYRSYMRGAGAYRHYIPSVVKAIASRSEFVTAYTPYQAEMSQGVLKAMFEYQTYICLLTGMDVSNASLYNGATAAAEAALMTKDRGRYKVFVTDNVRPDVLAVMKTYLTAKGMELNVIPSEDGATDVSALKALLDGSAAAVYAEQPNYFGIVEDLEAIGETAHAAGAKFIAGCNPISLALLKTPAEYVPGINSVTYCIAVGNVDTGMYAPIRKPIAALNIPTNPECAPSVFTNVTHAAVAMTDTDITDSIVIPIAAKTSAAVRYQPVIARYTKAIARTIRHTIDDTTTLYNIYDAAMTERFAGEARKSEIIPDSRSLTKRF